MLTLYRTILTFNDPTEESFGYTVGKEENAGSSFPTVFPSLLRIEIIIQATFNLSSANAFNLVTFEILSFGKELRMVRQGM